MNYSKEDYEFLSNFEAQFKSAINSHFVRMDNRITLAKLDTIYNKVFGKKSNLLGGCNRCVVDSITKLGNLYYKDKEEMAKEATKTASIDLIQPECATTSTTTTKAATKKKGVLNSNEVKVKNTTATKKTNKK